MSEEQTSLDPYADNPDVVLRDHVYDGIQEYDQKLPNWWLWTLYIFIILFVVIWFLYYQIGIFKTDGERVDAQVAAIEEQKAEKLRALMGELNDGVLWEMSRNTPMVEAGKATYKQVCMACHAPDLSGNSAGPQYVGLPLSDKEWKYGATPMEIFATVMNGSPDKTKGMAPWASLGGDTVAKVVAYVLSHHTIPEDIGKEDG
jgi:cytochrome c oxidase cbb3-type subunit 3